MRQMKKEEIQKWLTDKISEITGITKDKISHESAFADFGLASRESLSICGDLEELLEAELEPTLLYDFPSIQALSEHLSSLKGT